MYYVRNDLTWKEKKSTYSTLSTLESDSCLLVVLLGTSVSLLHVRVDLDVDSISEEEEISADVSTLVETSLGL